MDSGIEIRIRKIFFSSDDNRALCIACDHGLMIDPNQSWLHISDVVQCSSSSPSGWIIAQFWAGFSLVGQNMAGDGYLLSSSAPIGQIYFTLRENLFDSRSMYLAIDHLEYRRLMNGQEVLYRYGGSAAIGFLFIDPDRKIKSLTIRASRD